MCPVRFVTYVSGRSQHFTGNATLSTSDLVHVLVHTRPKNVASLHIPDVFQGGTFGIHPDSTAMFEHPTADMPCDAHDHQITRFRFRELRYRSDSKIVESAMEPGGLERAAKVKKAA